MAAEAEENETSPEVLADIISLVAGVMIPAAVIATWTVRERETAAEWASAEHLTASDSTGIKRVPEPGFVARAAEICASPVMAQLAVEAWTAYRELGEFSSGWEDVYNVAQGAVTGLLVLLGGRQDQQPAWRETAVRIMREHRGGIREVDLMGMLGEGCPSREALLGWLQQEEAAGIVERELSGGGTWRLKGARL